MEPRNQARIAFHLSLWPFVLFVFAFAFDAPDGFFRGGVAALIFRHKPSENEEYKNAFPFDKTDGNTKGRNAKLSSSFWATMQESPLRIHRSGVAW